MSQASDVETQVARHYSGRDLTRRLLAAIGAEAVAPGALPRAALSPVDQLHHGGFAQTERLAEVAGVAQGMRVLDAGSGIGGAARFLADAYGCRVDAIDLSADFVASASDLDVLVGLSDAITQTVGSVTNLPYAPAAFDLVWSQNVTMNVADKPAMFAEVLRVLAPGGVFAFTHICGTEGAPPDYPLPWAQSAQTSFLETEADLLALLDAAGFARIERHVFAPPPPPPGAADGPSDAVAMGDDMPLRRKNGAQSVADGRLNPVMITARRAGA